MHAHAHVLGTAHIGGEREVAAAIAAARAAWIDWSGLSWIERSGIYLRAADLLLGFAVYGAYGVKHSRLRCPQPAAAPVATETIG